jgi:hypothetical protein
MFLISSICRIIHVISILCTGHHCTATVHCPGSNLSAEHKPTSDTSDVANLGAKTTLAEATVFLCVEREGNCETHCSCCHVAPRWLMDHTATCRLDNGVKSWVQLQPQPCSSAAARTGILCRYGCWTSSLNNGYILPFLKPEVPLASGLRPSTASTGYPTAAVWPTARQCLLVASIVTPSLQFYWTQISTYLVLQKELYNVASVTKTFIFRGVQTIHCSR